MIRVIKQKNADIRCTFMQIVLLLAMMLCLAKPQLKEQVGKPVSQHVVCEKNQDTFTGYTSTETRF
jgi:hypothetical protein